MKTENFKNQFGNAKHNFLDSVHKIMLTRMTAYWLL
jgi:hypothetical protein